MPEDYRFFCLIVLIYRCPSNQSDIHPLVIDGLPCDELEELFGGERSPFSIRVIDCRESRLNILSDLDVVETNEMDVISDEE